MRRMLLTVAIPILLAASAPVSAPEEPLDASLDRAEKERADAEAQAAKFERLAASARDRVAKLRAEQASAAQQIEAAEARLTAADARLRLLAVAVDRRRQHLAQEQQPVSSLLAGLVLMARQPPLLAVADPGSADELVKLRVLLNSTLPVIRAKTASLSAELRRGKELEAAAGKAKQDLVSSRDNLAVRRQRFAALEQQALRAASGAEGEALGAGDIALATGESIEQLRGSESSRVSAQRLASQLAALDPAPARPGAGQGATSVVPFAYALPVNAPVSDGLGSVSPSGIRSRGVTFRTGRGVPVSAPAPGTIQFSGPFRDYDGILIIDHGGGWITLLVNVASPLTKGDRVQMGDAVGRTIGPLGAELSQNGRRYSPALIAGSSRSLSKGAKGG